MRKNLLMLFIVIGCASSTFGQDSHSEQEKKQDIARHRLMAQAHEAAARCLESGKPSEVCWKALQDTCKGLAIGKYCGMKHQH